MLFYEIFHNKTKKVNIKKVFFYSHTYLQIESSLSNQTALFSPQINQQAKNITSLWFIIKPRNFSQRFEKKYKLDLFELTNLASYIIKV